MTKKSVCVCVICMCPSKFLIDHWTDKHIFIEVLRLRLFFTGFYVCGETNIASYLTTNQTNCVLYRGTH